MGPLCSCLIHYMVMVEDAVSTAPIALADMSILDVMFSPSAKTSSGHSISPSPA